MSFLKVLLLLALSWNPTRAQETSSSQEETCTNDQLGNDTDYINDNNNNNNHHNKDNNEVKRRLERTIVIKEWGKPQVVDFDEEKEATLEVIQQTEEYMKEIYANEEYKHLRQDCYNYYALCSRWAANGGCEDEEERDFMIGQCSPACLTCDLLEELLDKQDEMEEEEEEESDDTEEEEKEEEEESDDEEEEEEEEEESEDDDDDDDEVERGESVKSHWGMDQALGTNDPEKVLEILKEADNYMLEEVYLEEQYEEVFDRCEYKDDACALYASLGHCEDKAHKTFMTLECAPVCRTCHLLDFKTRCPVDHNKPVAWPNVGDLNAMFERITTDPYWKAFGPITVLSSPETDGPWVVTLDNFVTEEETQALIEYGQLEGYERSADVGEMNDDGTYEDDENDGRTSTNTWCDEDCNTDPITEPLHRRLDKLAGLHYNHSEYLQLLRYEEGQFYNEHHDYIHGDADRPVGPRILTIFLYLSDVEEGGGTRFGPLDMTVMPKRGRALVWPSVLNEDPMEWDERTMHEALPVEKGLKYGANAWYHQRDFKTPYLQDCS